MWNPDAIPPPIGNVYRRYGKDANPWPIIGVLTVIVLASIVGLRL